MRCKTTQPKLLAKVGGVGGWWDSGEMWNYTTQTMRLWWDVKPHNPNCGGEEGGVVDNPNFWGGAAGRGELWWNVKLHNPNYASQTFGERGGAGGRHPSTQNAGEMLNHKPKLWECGGCVCGPPPKHLKLLGRRGWWTPPKHPKLGWDVKPGAVG